MPGPALIKSANRPVLTLEPCRDVETLCAFYRDQFPGFGGDLLTAAVERIAAAHPFLTIRDEQSLVGAIGAVSYETRPATELILEHSRLPGIGIHKILAALETIWAFHTNDRLEFCFCVTEKASISSKNYGNIGFHEVDVGESALPLEERPGIIGVPLLRNMVMMLPRVDINHPVKWLRSRFHSGRFLASSPGQPTYRLEDESLRIPLFRIVAGMKAIPAAHEED
jgi:hypothetical protein